MNISMKVSCLAIHYTEVPSTCSMNHGYFFFLLSTGTEWFTSSIAINLWVIHESVTTAKKNSSLGWHYELRYHNH